MAAFVTIVMPCRFSSRISIFAARLSERESTMSPRMMSVTSAPAEFHIDANSSAVAPEPITTALCGKELSASALVESMST